MEAFFALILMFFSQFLGIDIGEVHTTNDEDVLATEVAQVVSVVDGDTIKVLLNGEEETVRYIGIDTPEPYRDGEPACYSGEATVRNRDMVGGKDVRLVPDTENRDRYGRLLRYVYAGDLFVNKQLVSEGYATTLAIKPNTQFKSQFALAQTSARASGVGLWSACLDQAELQPESTTSGAAVISSTQLTAGQQQLLTSLGIDPAGVTVTAQMLACANDAVGIGRLVEITTGGIPSIAEGIKLVSCYKL